MASDKWLLFKEYLLYNDHLLCPNYCSNLPHLITYELLRFRLEACQIGDPSCLYGRYKTNRSVSKTELLNCSATLTRSTRGCLKLISLQWYQFISLPNEE